MIGSILHRLFGLGRLPSRDQSALKSEGLRIVHEGISGSVNYRNYRAPGKIFIRKKIWFLGSLVVTEKRFVAYGFSRRIFNMALGSSDLQKWKIWVEDGRRLCLGCDASELSQDQSGNIEFRFTIPDAEIVADFLKNKA